MKSQSVSVLRLLVLLTGVCWAFFSYINKSYANEAQVESIVVQENKSLVEYDEWVNKKQEQQLQEKKELEARQSVEEMKKNKVSMIAVGDIMLSRAVGRNMKKINDYNYPFLEVQEIISNADIAFGNLEAPFFTGNPVDDNSFLFRSDEEAVSGLDFAGFDMLSLANNHALNQGQAGLLNTMSLLERNNIDFCGAAKGSEENQLSIVQVKDLKFGFLCYSYGPSETMVQKGTAGIFLMKLEQLKKDLAMTRDKVDFIIVSMHAGEEYQSRSSDFQKEFARTAIDFGAEVVFGHHPHVVQEAEKYKDKFIFYSLGNFVFDQNWSRQTCEGLVVKLDFDSQGMQGVELLPIIIENNFQPRQANAEEAKIILNYLD